MKVGTENLASRTTTVSTMAVGAGRIVLHRVAEGIVVLDERLQIVRVVALDPEPTPITVLHVTPNHAIVAGKRWATIDLETGEVRWRGRGDAAPGGRCPASDLLWHGSAGEVVVYDRRDLSIVARHLEPEIAGDPLVYGRGQECFVELLGDDDGDAPGLGAVLRLDQRQVRRAADPWLHHEGIVDGWLDDDHLIASAEHSLAVIDARRGRTVTRVALPGFAMAAHVMSPTAVLVQGSRHELWRVDLATERVTVVEVEGGPSDAAIRALHVLDERRFVTLWSGDGRLELLRVDRLGG